MRRRSTTTRTADFNAGWIAGNVLIIAANTGEPTTDDQFKIENAHDPATGARLLRELSGRHHRAGRTDRFGPEPLLQSGGRARN